MSYDILFFPRGPGQTVQEALDAANDVPDSAGPALLPVWDRLEARLRQVLPTVEGGRAGPGQGMVGELAEPGSGLTVELFAGEAAVSFPYWDHADEAGFSAMVGEVVRIVAEETGWAAHDPQTDAEFHPARMYTGPGMDLVHQLRAETSGGGTAAMRRARRYLVVGVPVTLVALAWWAFDGFGFFVGLALAIGVLDIALGLTAWREAGSSPIRS